MTLVYIFLAAILAVGLVHIWMGTKKNEGMDTGEMKRLMDESATLKAEVKRLTQDMARAQKQVEFERDEKNELMGKNKALFVQHENLKAELKHLTNDRDLLQEKMAKLEANEKRKEKEIESRMQQLTIAHQSFEDEKMRVRREDEERQKAQEEERDRLWATHEMNVIASLTELCKQPAFSFTSYTNTNLPEGFDGSLKPDFMIEFLGQYVIFDAKISKAKNLQTYISTQVKTTVEKVKDNEKIYKSIFLVVPSSAIGELKTHCHIVDGFSIYIISPEAIQPILASLKRISLYEFAEQMDPQQRENVIQMIAELDFHINLRNAADIILSKMGSDLLEKTQRLDASIAEEVAIKKIPMNAKAALAATEIKKIVANLTIQNDEIRKLVSPKASVHKKHIQEAGAMMSDSLF